MLAGACVIVIGLGVAILNARDDGAPHPAHLDPGALLPDLDQETPSDLDVRLEVRDGQGSYVLGFTSRMRNIGDGPLVIEGSGPPQPRAREYRWTSWSTCLTGHKTGSRTSER